MRGHRIELDRLVPVWADGRRTAVRMALLIAASAFLSLGAPVRFVSALRECRELHIFMPPFKTILGGALVPFIICCFVFTAEAAFNYAGHRTGGSRSDYTMRRLPKRWEFHMRCVLLPLIGVIAACLAALILWLIFRWLYFTFTPPEFLRDMSFREVL